MNYVNAKIASELKLGGVSIAFDKVGDVLKAVYFKDAKGNNFRITYENYTSLNAQVPAPPKKEKRYVLRGELSGLGKDEKHFVEKYDAEAAKRELDRAATDDGEFTISCEEVEIAEDAPVSDDGTIPF